MLVYHWNSVDTPRQSGNIVHKVCESLHGGKEPGLEAIASNPGSFPPCRDSQTLCTIFIGI